MAFNVSEFKAKIDNYGGIAKANKFLVKIYQTNWYSDRANAQPNVVTGVDQSAADKVLAEPQMLSFLCDTVNLPGKALQTIDFRPDGFGRISKIPYDISHSPLNTTFMLDSDHRVMRFFQMWMQEITNTGSVAGGPQATYRDRTAYEMNYKKNYTTTIEIWFFDDTGSKSLQYVFFDCFPVQLGDVSLGWEQNDTIARLPVEFTYSSYTVFKEDLPLQTYSSRGNNLFQNISYLMGVAGVINNIHKPTGIQDFINQMTNIRLLF